MNDQQTASVVIIGNEILSGRTQDVNLSFIASRLEDLGIILSEARVIPDIEHVIIETVDECRKKYSYVFTTGGIGPTHDDITTAAIAKAFNKEIVRNPEAQRLLEAYYPANDLSDARLKMADIPLDAELIDNPVSGAPGFQLNNVFVLPGVPKIMQAMFDGITDRLTASAPILTSSVITDMREGQIADGLALLQEDYPEISIGSYPFFKNRKFGVNVIMRGTNQSRLDELTDAMQEMLKLLGGKILQLEHPETE